MAHKIAIKLDVFAPTPLYQQLANELKKLISDGLLFANEKLPSLRDLSRQLQISVITVRQAVELLIEQGYLVSRPGSGNYVSETFAKPAAANAKPTEEPRFMIGSFRGYTHELEENAVWSQEAWALTRAFNDYPFHPWWDVEVKYDFRAYQPSAEFLHGARWDRAFLQAAKEVSAMPDVCLDPAGMPELRIELANWLNRTRQLDCVPEEIVIVSGAQQARDLTARLLVKPGSRVVVEEPGSITDLLAYATKGASLIHVAQQDDGVDTAALSQVKQPVVAHLIDSANFPSGSTLSLSKRQQVLEWAAQTKSIIVEDAYGAGFHYETDMPAPLFALNRQTQVPVVYIGSLSQFTTPAFRLGFIVTKEPLRSVFATGKWMLDRHCSLISQQVLLRLFKEGFFDEHYLKLMNSCRLRRQALIQNLQKWSPELIRFTPVKCGFQQAVWFTKAVDDLHVFEKGLQKGLGVIPLSPYFHEHEPKSGISLNFARLDEASMQEGLQILQRTIDETIMSAAGSPI